MYIIDGANDYSVKWSVTSLAEGDNWLTEGKNVLNDYASDFVSAGANIVDIKTIALNDADIQPGCSLGVICQSDASNTDELYIMSVWIEQT